MNNDRSRSVNERLKWELWGVGLLLGLGVALLVGVGWWAQQSGTVYPLVERQQGGNCSTSTLTRRGKTLKIERYFCYTTADSPGEVLFWYGAQGYEYRNDGRVFQSEKELFLFHMATVERVYIIPRQRGETYFRVYRDLYIRFP